MHVIVYIYLYISISLSISLSLSIYIYRNSLPHASKNDFKKRNNIIVKHEETFRLLSVMNNKYP